MSRARILADYVSSGVTAAEFDFLDTTSGTPGSGTFLRGDKTWQEAGGGIVLQTEQTLYRDIVSFTAETAAGVSNYGDSRAGYDATVLDSAITPSATSSKILIMTNIVVSLRPPAYSTLKLKRGTGGNTPTLDGNTGWSAGDTPANWHNDRSSTPGSGTNAGAQPFFSSTDDFSFQACVINWYFLDSPATTSEVVYRFNLNINCGNVTKTAYINRVDYNGNDFGNTSGISTIILQEIAA